MRVHAIVFAAALLLAPPGAQAADLVVWWEQGFNPEEDAAVREIVAVFEEETGKRVELSLHDELDLPAKIVAALQTGHPPDFAFGLEFLYYIAEWAYSDQLADLQGPLAPVLDLFDADAIEASMLLNSRTGERALYALPMAVATNHLHVWKSLLERGRLHPGRYPEGVGGVLVFLVRPGATGRACGAWPGRHLGDRATHVRRGRRHAGRDRSVPARV